MIRVGEIMAAKYRLYDDKQYSPSKDALLCSLIWVLDVPYVLIVG